MAQKRQVRKSTDDSVELARAQVAAITKVMATWHGFIRTGPEEQAELAVQEFDQLINSGNRRKATETLEYSDQSSG